MIVEEIKRLQQSAKQTEPKNYQTSNEEDTWQASHEGTTFKKRKDFKHLVTSGSPSVHPQEVDHVVIPTPRNTMREPDVSDSEILVEPRGEVVHGQTCAACVVSHSHVQTYDAGISNTIMMEKYPGGEGEYKVSNYDLLCTNYLIDVNIAIGIPRNDLPDQIKVIPIEL